MKNRFVFLFLFHVVVLASAQEDSVFQAIRSQTILNRLSGGNGIGRTDMIAELKLPPKRLVGSAYLNNDWTIAVILLIAKDQVVDGVPIKYDAQTNLFDVKTLEGVKVLGGDMVRSFAWRDKITGEVEDFENVRNYKQEFYKEGMFKRLTTGSLSLLSITEVSIKKADYNVQLNVGSTNDEVIKKEKLYYVAADGRVAKLPKSKKKLLELFGSFADAMREYIDSHALSVSAPGDVKNIFTHYKVLSGAH